MTKRNEALGTRKWESQREKIFTKETSFFQTRYNSSRHTLYQLSVERTPSKFKSVFTVTVSYGLPGFCNILEPVRPVLPIRPGASLRRQFWTHLGYFFSFSSLSKPAWNARPLQCPYLNWICQECSAVKADTQATRFRVHCTCYSWRSIDQFL